MKDRRQWAKEYEDRLAAGEDPAEVLSAALDHAERFQKLWDEAEDRWRDGALKPWADEIQRLRALVRADDGDVGRMREALGLHYGEPVRPVSEYCNALWDWFDACQVAAEEYDALTEEQRAWRSPPPLYEIREHLWKLRYLDIGKSNYLWRRIYAGDPHRTEKCPKHKGHWSGCYPPGTEHGDCECVFGGNTTGWLPAE